MAKQAEMKMKDVGKEPMLKQLAQEKIKSAAAEGAVKGAKLGAVGGATEIKKVARKLQNAGEKTKHLNVPKSTTTHTASTGSKAKDVAKKIVDSGLVVKKVGGK